MKTFKVKVNWVVSKEYEVEAESAEAAKEAIQKRIDDGDVCVWTDGFEATDDVTVSTDSTVIKYFNVANIDWDTSDYDDDAYDPASPNIPDLPSSVYDMGVRLDPDFADDDEYVKDAISDWLLDVYGFCVNGFSYEESEMKD